MNSEKFKNAFLEAGEYLDPERIDYVTDKVLLSELEFGDNMLLHMKILCIEELGELIQAITKNLRGKNNTANVLEEMADVTIMLRYLKKMYGFTDEQLGKAVNVKLDRAENIVTRYGCYE